MPVRVSEETTYYFGLFIAPVGTPEPPPGVFDDPHWQFVVAYATNSNAAGGEGRLQKPDVATVVGYAPGTNVNFIVRGWRSNTGGADWPAAKHGLYAIGQSAMGTAWLGGGPIPVPSAFGSSYNQISGFDIYLCPKCKPPSFWLNPSNAVVSLGDNVTFSASASSLFPVNYQWRKQSSPITGATNSNLTLTNVTLSDAGNYDVLASYYYGSTPSSLATLTVLMPVIAATLGSPTNTADNQFQFTVAGSTGSNYVVQVATNLSPPTVWVSLFTNTSPFTFVDTNANNFPQRFYRAHTPLSGLSPFTPPRASWQTVPERRDRQTDHGGNGN